MHLIFISTFQLKENGKDDTNIFMRMATNMTYSQESEEEVPYSTEVG